MSWTPETERLVIATFTRLADLYGAKCKSRGLVIMQQSGRPEEQGTYSAQFLLWCRKCCTLAPRQFERALAELEYQAGQAAREGRETWPPSYAEFIGLASAGWETKAQRPQAPVDLNAAQRIEHNLPPMTAEEFFEKWTRNQGE